MSSVATDTAVQNLSSLSLSLSFLNILQSIEHTTISRKEPFK